MECTPAFMMIQVPAAHGPGMVLGEACSGESTFDVSHTDSFLSSEPNPLLAKL